MEPLGLLVCLAKRLTDLQIPDASRQRVAADLAPADAACAKDDSVGSLSVVGSKGSPAGAEKADKRQRSIFAAAAPAYDDPHQVDQCGGRSTVLLYLSVLAQYLGLMTPATAALPDFARVDGASRWSDLAWPLAVPIPCRPPDR